MPRKRKLKFDKRRSLTVQKKAHLPPNISPGPSTGSESDGNLREMGQIIQNVNKAANFRQEVNEDTIEAALALVHADSSGDEAQLVRSVQIAHRNHAQPSPSGTKRSFSRRLDAAELLSSDSGSLLNSI